MADARAVNFTPGDLGGILQVPPGAAGTAQPAQIITPPGYYDQQSPWSSAFGQIFDNMQQEAAQRKAMEQYNQAVKGIGEFWPQLQSMGVSEGQVNSMLKSGMSPQDIIHSAFTDEASRHMKLFDWAREDYTHARGVNEASYTPDQLDVVDQYRQGNLSLPDTMRRSGLQPSQLSSALSQMAAGQALQGGLTANQQKDLLLKKDELELADLPTKLQQDGKKRMLEIQKSQWDVDHAQNREDREDARQTLEQQKFDFEKWKFDNKPASSKTLPADLQQQANTLKGLATPQAMYMQAKKAGFDVRPPAKAPSGKFGLASGKAETKDSYFKDVIIPALQNKHLTTPASPQPGTSPTLPAIKNSQQSAKPFTYPNTPMGNATHKAAIEFGIDPDIFGRQIRQESGFNPNAVSSAGARGPAQLMPDTAKALGVNINNPFENVRGGAKQMKILLDHYGGDYVKALSDYNAGPDQRRWNNPETRNYVKLILGTDSVIPVSKQIKRKSLDDIL
jgi:soluble lytic murein transglycosylase-like protein